MDRPNLIRSSEFVQTSIQTTIRLKAPEPGGFRPKLKKVAINQ